MRGYAVFDLETTGFSPRSDRIVEVGVVALHPDGSVEDEWETLVNPGRDVGATRVHGITASDVLGAPRFRDVAEDLEEVLEGRALVAHNASFDVRFLTSEMVRAGRLATGAVPPSVCTMRNARRFLSVPSVGLADCCAAAGVDLRNAHSALGDARATAELFGYYLTRAGGSLPWADVLGEVDGFCGWAPRGHGSHLDPGTERPRGGPRRARWTRADGAAARGAGSRWMTRAVGTRDTADGADAEEYFALVDRALLDRCLSQSEQAELLDFAARSGLSEQGLLDLHVRYLGELARAAWEDGVLEDSEVEEFTAVARLLGVPAGIASGTLRSVGTETGRGATPEGGVGRVAGDGRMGGSPGSPRPCRAGRGLVLDAGDRVVVTSPRLLSREEWERRILGAGLEPGGIRRSAKVLVAGDPDSMSGKARKAREYGIPIVTEEAMVRLLDERVTGAEVR